MTRHLKLVYWPPCLQAECSLPAAGLSVFMESMRNHRIVTLLLATLLAAPALFAARPPR